VAGVVAGNKPAYGVFAHSAIPAGTILSLFAPRCCVTYDTARADSRYAYTLQFGLRAYDPVDQAKYAHAEFAKQLKELGKCFEAESRLAAASRARLTVPSTLRGQLGFLVNHMPRRSPLCNVSAVKCDKNLIPFVMLKSKTRIRPNQQLFYTYNSNAARLFEGIKPKASTLHFASMCPKCHTYLSGPKERRLHRFSCANYNNMKELRVLDACLDLKKMGKHMYPNYSICTHCYIRTHRHISWNPGPISFFFFGHCEGLRPFHACGYAYWFLYTPYSCLAMLL
jgi:hypothetical protein